MNDWAKLASKISQAKQKEATEDKRGRIRVSSGSIDGNRNHVQVEGPGKKKSRREREQRKSMKFLRETLLSTIEPMKAGINIKPARRNTLMSTTVSGGSERSKCVNRVNRGNKRLQIPID